MITPASAAVTSILYYADVNFIHRRPPCTPSSAIGAHLLRLLLQAPGALQPQHSHRYWFLHSIRLPLPPLRCYAQHQKCSGLPHLHCSLVAQLRALRRSQAWAVRPTDWVRHLSCQEPALHLPTPAGWRVETWRLEASHPLTAVAAHRCPQPSWSADDRC